MSEQTSGLGPYLPVVVLLAVVIVLGALIYFLVRPEPRMAIVWGIAILVGAAVPAGLLMKWNRQAEFAASLQRDGVKGIATVVKAQSTNVRVDRKAQVRLHLRIKLPGRAPYEQETLQLVPFGQAATPGRAMYVHVDPNDPERLLLDWETAVSPQATTTAVSGGSTLAHRLAGLEQARKQGLITEQEFQEQRRRLLSEH